MCNISAFLITLPGIWILFQISRASTPLEIIHTFIKYQYSELIRHSANLPCFWEHSQKNEPQVRRAESTRLYVRETIKLMHLPRV